MTSLEIAFLRRAARELMTMAKSCPEIGDELQALARDLERAALTSSAAAITRVCPRQHPQRGSDSRVLGAD